MNKEKIAILVDSGVDIPSNLVNKYNMYVAPLTIIYSDKEYSDGVDITAEEVYSRLETEIPSTSLPSGQTIQNIFNKIKEDGYVFNKDAGTMQCPEGHLAMRCYKTLTKSGNYQYCYYFSMKKCRNCIHYGNCCKVGIKKKKYTITVMHGCRQDHFEFQESDYFKERIKQRYKIEAKNGELKQVHGLTRCKYAGLFGMKLQMFFTAFVANVKRIIKLKEIELAR